jgi:hypothetical protein
MTDDPFDVLTRLHEHDQRLNPGDNPAADALRDHIVAAGTAPSRRQRRLRWGATTAAAAVALAASGVAAAWWATRPSDTTTVACYSNASTTPATQIALLREPAQTPQQQCKPLWSDGTLGDDGPPPLASCVTDAGIVAVIPGPPEVCDHLSLDSAADPANDDVAALIVSAVSQRWPRTCVTSVDAATTVIDEIFDDVEASDWTISNAGDVTTDRPCLYAAVDAEQHTVTVIAAAAPPR